MPKIGETRADGKVWTGSDFGWQSQATLDKQKQSNSAPKTGDRRSDGKVWAGSDLGWQNPATIWKGQTPGKEVGEKRTLPGLGTKVWTGKDFGWQTQATIDRKGAPAPATPDPKLAPATPDPAAAPVTPDPKLAPATPDPAAAPVTPDPAAAPVTPDPAASTPPAKPVPPKSARQLELDKINADTTLSPEKKWEIANPGLAAARRERKAIRGTSETDNPLMQGLRSKLPAAKTALDTTAFKADLAKSGIKPSAYSSLLNNPRRMRYQQPSVEKTLPEAYDVVLDYLLSEGHADTVEEAHYVMMQMDAENIQSIVAESGYFPTPKSQREDEAKYRLSRDRLPGQHKPQKPEKKVEEQMMPPINPEAHRKQQRIEKATQLKKGTSGAESQAAGAAVKRLGGSGVSLPPV